ncbi:N-acetylmuramic acid 6-phosphate etherase [Gracilibacillus boraciitolerans JCM 21714]|uniref:N-acetylmuramic acid 6-phosphate etherase n=1 Tax=Gracilibacillus boraciitolerans JCM 21714 TaxID=1298598 RepID=W4VIH2_9BACI|nr:N-acetylmuramic acid 6-phosphate etherase [Gracilibacillus boraciitolerans]GAE93210.1 N-acetylmuramic acid 6-phosphate etherase [Gracilibacillus boraciitolerans JCM 21714]
MEQPTTESINKNTITMDEMSTMEIVETMIQEDHIIHSVLKQNKQQLSEAIDLITSQWQKGGRVIVAGGAGTSGRIGVLDAVELGPTFSVPSDRWIALLAGGAEATWKPMEQYEDSEEAIMDELDKLKLQDIDTVIAMTASGSTPYAIAALQYAKKVHAKRISISCNSKTLASEFSHIAIELVVGAEVIRGSTRLKAGTVQKIALNILSTATMIRLGKVYQNEMIEMQLINKKLVNRAVNTLMQLADISMNEAQSLMRQTNNNLKEALFMALTHASLAETRNTLEVHQGHLKKAIHTYLSK